MRDSCLMGLELFLLTSLPQVSWERLVRRGPMVGSPRTASSAAAAGLEGHCSGGRQQAQGPCQPMSASAWLGPGSILSPRWEKTVCTLEELLWESIAIGKSPWFPPARCRTALEADEGFPACSSARVRWRRPEGSVVIGFVGFFFPVTQISFYLPLSYSPAAQGATCVLG